MELQDILTIIDKVCEKDNLHLLQIEEADFKLTVETNMANINIANVPNVTVEAREVNSTSSTSVVGQSTVKRSIDASEKSEMKKSDLEIAENTASKSAEKSYKENFDKVIENKTLLEGKVVKSPLVGTFYAASSEHSEPFVTVGSIVHKGQVLGIVEAMKLMNDIESEVDGEVVQILVENGQIVEYGQELFVIR